MRDYPFNFNQLKNFSESIPYTYFSEEEKTLFKACKELEAKFHFPAIKNDVGAYISFMFRWIKPRRVFEFGSGYGQSAFWYLLGTSTVESIVLTEKRTDLMQPFNELPWPKEWRDKLDYYQGDAFEKFAQQGEYDFILIDGVKADYLKFLEKCYDKLSSGGIVLIDNSYWRGSFLDQNMVQSKQTARNIKALHDFISSNELFESIFIPFEDGVSLLRKK